METKQLLYGLVGFFIGGLLVSVAAVTFEKPTDKTGEVLMSQMTESLKNKKGDEFDKAFIADMIEHHQAAVDMAKLSAENAKHDEIKKMSLQIIAAQESEIAQMKRWQTEWGYSGSDSTHKEH